MTRLRWLEVLPLDIKPNRTAVERGAAQLPADSEGILGLQFENVILKNRTSVWKMSAICQSI